MYVALHVYRQNIYSKYNIIKVWPVTVHAMHISLLILDLPPEFMSI